MKTYLHIAAAIFALTLASCKKEDPTPDNSNNTPAPNTSSGDYQPMTLNSTWSYDGPTPYTITMGDDTTINGNVWKTAINSASSSNAAVRKVGGHYYNRAKGPSGENLEILNLKDNEPVGASWNNDMTINGIPTRYTFSISQKDISYTVKGVTFTNVIRVHLDAYFDTGSGYALGGAGEYYYAKDVGFIYSDLGAQGITELISYDIK